MERCSNYRPSVLSFLCTVAIVCSLAEVASIYPTAGGPYHWVAALAPPETRSPAAWFTGWISIGGQTLLTASSALAAGLQLQSLITLNHPNSYSPQRWQGMLCYWAILMYSSATNIWGSKVSATVNNIADHLYLLFWTEIIMPVESIVVIELHQMRSTGRFLCWDSKPESIVHVRFGSQATLLSDVDAATELAKLVRNK
ncbi:uncharacterized protein E0L32_011519 [Thyridium curvatum]|uniref:MoaF C-terminal domain-containing protein n=1 Tax=Thyridium curvatum TaxID=1093900 RepID=A0A507BPS7_9PEZI|nr:uncharacterized protein E0L32_011519 [Thyridium curvatum]TPX18770.1 hypothetical protein E0L32_011519 [Thyridium curvatum]